MIGSVIPGGIDIGNDTDGGSNVGTGGNGCGCDGGDSADVSDIGCGWRGNDRNEEMGEVNEDRGEVGRESTEI